MKLRTAHASLKAGDTDQQHTIDIEKIFDRAIDRRVAWITGTEAGPGAGNMSKELVRIGGEHGYRMWVPNNQKTGAGKSTDCWIGVRKDLVVSGWKTGFRPAIPGSQELYKRQGLDPDLNPRWGPKGLVTVEFQSLASLGEINIGAAHYLTKARSPRSPELHGVDHWDWNQKLTDVIGEWAREVGKGSSLAFYGGDQNMADDKNKEPQGDTFMGEPLTSMADELKKWQNTGHGAIDVMASYDADGRVRAESFVVLDDKEFFLHTDHFYLEGTWDVRSLNTKR